MRRKHFLFYYDHALRDYVKKTPRDWARENRAHFPNYGFTSSEDSPRDVEIEKYLKSEYRFVEFTYDEVVVLCNFDTQRAPF